MIVGPVKFCWDLQKRELVKVLNAPWPETSFIIHHYARSLEKFTVKQRSWKQHVNAGYDIGRFLERSHGWTFDNTALRYSCQWTRVPALPSKNRIDATDEIPIDVPNFKIWR